MEGEYIVYVRVNSENFVLAIASSAFVDGEGWIEVDRGQGAKYMHAQGHYLARDIVDEYGRFNYKFVNGQVVERTEEEKAHDQD